MVDYHRGACAPELLVFSSPRVPNTTHQILLITEVAETCRAPIGTVRHWMRTGQLASFRLGRRRVVRHEALQDFLRKAGDSSLATAAEVER